MTSALTRAHQPTPRAAWSEAPDPFPRSRRLFLGRRKISAAESADLLPAPAQLVEELVRFAEAFALVG